ncbi:MAG: 4'-phosphopantetheinyl transferase superfamily protein [Propioniciclava sp.]|uniref:4'-phosphopantetheinyl transferase family protein n=1 Tax=Propioniciclava sp. TaxID=2038686 RepID=UPI0039E570C7
MTDAAAPAVVRFETVTGDEDAGLLTAAERQRRDLLRFAADREAFVAAHVLVRRCAGALLGCDPAEIEIVQRCAECGGPHGRPSVLGSPGVYVSLSHTRGWVAACAAFVPCGIDVEVIRPVAPIASVLTGYERAWMAAQPDAQATFLRLWVRKEALVKAGFGTLDHLAGLDALRPPGQVSDWSGGDAVGACAVARLSGN